VLKKLTGKKGPTGLQGKEGPKGEKGVQGEKGEKGSAGTNLTAETTLPSGQSESGTFAAAGPWAFAKECEPKVFCFGFIGTGITYVQPLASPIPEENVIDVTKKSAPHCPGLGKAERGYLCLYDWDQADVEGTVFYSGIEKEEHFSTPYPGAVLYWTVKEEGEPYVGGEYTVTAP